MTQPNDQAPPLLPYIPLFVVDWIGNYSHLSLAAQGALLKLVIHQWRFESVPGGDMRALSEILGVSRGEATKLFTPLAGFYNMRTLEGGWQISYWVTARAKALKKAQTDKARAESAARGRWGDTKNARSNTRSNAPSIPPSIENDAPRNAPSNAPSNPSQSLDLSDLAQKQDDDLEIPQGPLGPEPPPPSESRGDIHARYGGSIIGRGEAVAVPAQAERRHAGCHHRVCAWRSGARRCMPAVLVAELANNYTEGTIEARCERLIDWARAYVPPSGSVTNASDFVFWRKAFDADQASRGAGAEVPVAASTVPSEADTIARYGA